MVALIHDFPPSNPDTNSETSILTSLYWFFFFFFLCRMAALHLVVEEFDDDPKRDVDQQIFAILRDFLQPDSKMSLGSASTSLLALLPEGNPNQWTYCS